MTPTPAHPQAQSQVEGPVTLERKVRDAVLDTQLWPIGGDDQGRTGGPSRALSMVSEVLVTCSVEVGD